MPAKKQFNDTKANRKRAARKEHVKATRQKLQPEREMQDWLDTVRVDTNDGRQVVAGDDFAYGSITYDESKLRRTLEKIFSEFVKHAVVQLPYTFQSPRGNLKMVAERIVYDAKIANPNEQVQKSVDIAARNFDHKLPDAIRTFIDQLILQAVIATLDELERSGAINFESKSGLRNIWLSYLEAYEKETKHLWAPRKPGKLPRVSKADIELLRFYDRQVEIAHFVINSRGKRKNVDDKWRREVQEHLGNIDEWTYTLVLENRESEDVALTLTGRHLGLNKKQSRDGADNLKRRLSALRKKIKSLGRLGITGDENEQIDERIILE